MYDMVEPFEPYRLVMRNCALNILFLVVEDFASVVADWHVRIIWWLWSMERKNDVTLAIMQCSTHFIVILICNFLFITLHSLKCIYKSALAFFFWIVNQVQNMCPTVTFQYSWVMLNSSLHLQTPIVHSGGRTSKTMDACTWRGQC